MQEPHEPVAGVYVKIGIGALSWAVMVYFFYLDITAPGIEVPAWVYVVMLAIMGATLGIDVLDQTRIPH